MRLSPSQIEEIKQETESFFGAEAEVWLFGSREDDAAKPGASGLVRRFSASRTAAASGFTLVELVMTILIVGILAVAAIPRLTSTDVFESRGFADQLQALLRYAQKTAIAQRATVCVVDTAAEIGLYAADCATPFNVLSSQKCATDSLYYLHKVCAPAGVTITSAHGNLSFTALGRTSAQRIYTVSGYASPITVEAETGYVHQ